MIRMSGASARRFAGLVAVSLAVAGSAFAENSQDLRPQPGCTNASLKGNFGFTAKGVTLPSSQLPASLQGVFASGGTASFDGKGKFTLASVSSFNGLIQPTPATGTYSVNKDCTYTSATETGATFRAVIVNGGDEILILQTTPGVVITGTAQTQSKSLPDFDELISLGRPVRCNNVLIKGSYGFLVDGVAGPPTLPPQMAGPLAGVGTVAFHPNETFLLKATRSVNGVLDPEEFSLRGTYSVASDCTFKMNFEVGFTFNAVIVNGGREILFLETDFGTTLLVKATRI